MTSSTDHGQRYGQWIAPKFDGALLIWPDASSLPAIARDNQKRLDAADHVHFAGRSLPDLRASFRIAHVEPANVPIIATGHQVELHHPGVWIKDVLAAAVAKQAGGHALHLHVDTDAPKHLTLKWPGFAEPITDDPDLFRAAWTGLLHNPSQAHRQMLHQRAASESKRTAALIDGLSETQSMQHAPPSLPQKLAEATDAINVELGVAYKTMMMSEQLRRWHPLLCELGNDAERFAEHYNAALADYRVEAGLEAGSERPMPDLATEGDRVELPFWLDDLERHTRQRLTVSLRPSPALVIGEERVPLDPGSLQTGLSRLRHRVAPRALTLTLFMRLVASDLFLHGIGGGHYDQVLDRLLQSYFGLEPPTFAVASATLLHPEAVGYAPLDLPALRRRGHALRHAVLDDEKQSWLARMNAVDGFFAKRDVFEAMHDRRRELLVRDADYSKWQRDMAMAKKQLAWEGELLDRELSFTLQPAERLRAMIDRVRDAVS